MRHRVSVFVLRVCVCVCLSVVTKSAAYIMFMLKAKLYMVLYGVFKVFVVADHASFKSSGIICWSLLPSAFPGKLSVDKRDSVSVCMVSHRSNKRAGSSLIVAHCQIYWLSVHAVNC